MTPLLDRLRQDLPGEWQPITDRPDAFHIQFGEGRLVVFFDKNGIWVGSNSTNECHGRDSWATLRAAASYRAAAIIVDEARQGRPTPTVPDWAHACLISRVGVRVEHLRTVERQRREELERLTSEREALSAILSTLTLGA